jgi:lysyl-tRNA synthetase class 2
VNLIGPEVRKSGSPDALWPPGASLETLQGRARLVGRVRSFFAERGVLEVDVPVLQGGANLDPSISPLAVAVHDGRRWLPTSPEHPLKRLVAAGYGDVWALHPAFRRGEFSHRHQPEFRMLEWYRCGWDDARLLTETVALLVALTGFGGGVEVLTWRAALIRHAGIDPVCASDEDWRQRLGDEATAVTIDGHLDHNLAADLVLANLVEPHLGRDGWTALTAYPARLAAQARIRDGVAARFELYRDGIELANGYHELGDGGELTARLTAEQAQRADAPDLDQRFLAAMDAGLPDCAGVAVGFDRVVMLALGLPAVSATMAFPWDRA